MNLQKELSFFISENEELISEFYTNDESEKKDKKGQKSKSLEAEINSLNRDLENKRNTLKNVEERIEIHLNNYSDGEVTISLVLLIICWIIFVYFGEANFSVIYSVLLPWLGLGVYQNAIDNRKKSQRIYTGYATPQFLELIPVFFLLTALSRPDRGEDSGLFTYLVVSLFFGYVAILWGYLCIKINSKFTNNKIKLEKMELDTQFEEMNNNKIELTESIDVLSAELRQKRKVNRVITKITTLMGELNTKLERMRSIEELATHKWEGIENMIPPTE